MFVNFLWLLYKLPQAWWLKTTGTYSLAALKSQISTLGSTEGAGRTSPPPAALASSVWKLLAFPVCNRIVPVSAFGLMWPSLLSVKALSVLSYNDPRDGI